MLPFACLLQGTELTLLASNALYWNALRCFYEASFAIGNVATSLACSASRIGQETPSNVGHTVKRRLQKTKIGTLKSEVKLFQEYMVSLPFAGGIFMASGTNKCYAQDMLDIS